MKNIILVVLISVFYLCNSCCFEPSFYKSNAGNYILEKENKRGIIFLNKDYAPLSEAEIKGRFTPTLREVSIVERILKNDLREFLSESSYRDRTIIVDSLDKYMRQYVGYINLAGEKEILINFIWNPDVEENFEYMETQKEVYNFWYEVQDGGEYYWNIKVNVEKKELREIQVNGSA